MQSRSSVLCDMLHQLCPRCRSGRIFRGAMLRFPKMYECCAVCGLKFEREEGYFLGAMYISYALSLACILSLSLLVWSVTHWPLVTVAACALAAFLPLAPVVTLFARVLWIYLDQAVDPDRTR
jgi:uncharacterized protein (DUF983 family)